MGTDVFLVIINNITDKEYTKLTSLRRLLHANGTKSNCENNQDCDVSITETPVHFLSVV